MRGPYRRLSPYKLTDTPLWALVVGRFARRVAPEAGVPGKVSHIQGNGTGQPTCIGAEMMLGPGYLAVYLTESQQRIAQVANHLPLPGVGRAERRGARQARAAAPIFAPHNANSPSGNTASAIESPEQRAEEA